MERNPETNRKQKIFTTRNLTLMAALIADLDPIGMFFVSIFLSGLQIGGSAIQRSLGIPLEIATIIQCCITLFVSVKLVFKIRKKKASKEEVKEGGVKA